MWFFFPGVVNRWGRGVVGPGGGGRRVASLRSLTTPSGAPGASSLGALFVFGGPRARAPGAKGAGRSRGGRGQGRRRRGVGGGGRGGGSRKRRAAFRRRAASPLRRGVRSGLALMRAWPVWRSFADASRDVRRGSAESAGDDGLPAPTSRCGQANGGLCGLWGWCGGLDIGEEGVGRGVGTGTALGGGSGVWPKERLPAGARDGHGEPGERGLEACLRGGRHDTTFGMHWTSSPTGSLRPGRAVSSAARNGEFG